MGSIASLDEKSAEANDGENSYQYATEVVHIGLVAMLMNASAELFNRACFNYPTLGDLYKYAAYDAILQQRAAGK